MKKGELANLFKSIYQSTKKTFIMEPVVEISGRHSVYIGGEQSVYEYSDNIIVVKLNHFLIEVMGSKLKISTLAIDGIEISGDIDQLKYRSLG